MIQQYDGQVGKRALESKLESRARLNAMTSNRLRAEAFQIIVSLVSYQGGTVAIMVNITEKIKE